MSDPDDPPLDRFESTQPIELSKTEVRAVSEPTRAIRPVEVDPTLRRFEPTQPIRPAELLEPISGALRGEPNQIVGGPRGEQTRPLDFLDPRLVDPRFVNPNLSNPSRAEPTLVKANREAPHREAPDQLSQEGEADRFDPMPESVPPEESPSFGWGAAIAAGVVAGLLVVAIFYVRWKSERIETAPPPEARTAHAAEPEPPASRLPAARPLPPLGASDAFVRAAVSKLSAHPQLARWVAGEELARRFVAIVINVAEGTSPASHLRELTPAEPFEAKVDRGRWFVTPSTFRRYDQITAAIDALDPRAGAELFQTLHPLFDLAYAEIGNPASSFDATLAKALGDLLRVPIPDPPVEVRPQGIGFAFADHGLEERTMAEKYLLRFGPENARRVQSKLGALAAACGIQPR